MQITWQVDDGYAGASAPQYTIIEDEEIEGMSEEEKQEYINKCVQEDFDQNINWYITGTED